VGGGPGAVCRLVRVQPSMRARLPGRNAEGGSAEGCRDVAGIAPQAAVVPAIDPRPSYLRLSLILTCVVSMTVPGAFRISSTPLSLFALLLMMILLPRGVSLSDTFAV